MSACIIHTSLRARTSEVWREILRGVDSSGSLAAMRPGVFASSFVAAIAFVVAASAERPPVLRVLPDPSAPANGCLSPSDLAEFVNRTLGRVGLFGPEATSQTQMDGSLNVAFSRSKEGWAVTITVRNASGEPAGAREIVRASEDCRTLDSALVLVAALLVDTQRAHEPKPVKVDAEPAAALARPDTKPRHPIAFETGLGATLAVGVMPTLAFAATGWGRLSAGRWVAGEIGATWFPRTSIYGRPGGLFDGGWFSFGYCPTLVEGGRASLVGCTRVGLGVANGVGTPPDVPERATVIYGLAGLAVRSRVSLAGPLGLSIELAAYAPLGRPRFFVRAGGAENEVFSPSPIYGTTTLSLEIRAR